MMIGAFVAINNNLEPEQNAVREIDWNPKISVWIRWMVRWRI
jgi:hypothetical protein